MLLPPLRPLVPISALAVLGWCWYAFRKRRNLGELVKEELLVSSAAKKQSMEELVPSQEAASDGSTLAAQDLNAHCDLQYQEKQRQEGSLSLSSYIETHLDPGCSQLSSTMDDLSVLLGASQAKITTSTPIVRLLKGIRPEPEGEVSGAQASSLLVEKPETGTEKGDGTFKGHPDFKAIETELSAQQPAETVWPKGHGVTNLPENQSERGIILSEVAGVRSGLVIEVINGATEEIMAIGGGILKRKGHEKPTETLQSEAQLLLQGEIGKNNGLLVTKKELVTLTKTGEERVPYIHQLSNQSMSPSTSQAGEDSGCSTCHSEDGAEAEEGCSRGQLCSALHVDKTCSTVSVFSETQEIQQDMARKNGNPSRQKADASKGANGEECVNVESRVVSNRATQSQNSSLTVWNVEVPAHLVGRLIGKQGKHVSFLKESSGAKIYVSTLSYTHKFQICHVEGSTVQVENALALIRKKFKDLDLSNRLQPADRLSFPITSWLQLPQDGTVEVIVPRVETANYLFVQQHTHPTYHVLCSLTEQMLFCYSHPGCPSLPTPVEAGVLCAAPSANGVWWRAQVIQHYKDSDTVQIRYVDYGGYVAVDLRSLRQIRSDFVTLPFQASEVMLENIVPLPGKGEFSFEAKEALEELTEGVPLIMKVTGSQSGLPLVHMWRQTGEEMISVNGVLVERGLCSWLDSH